MRQAYPLKKAHPSNFVEPLVSYIEHNDSPKLAMSMRDTLSAINQLRNKCTSLELPKKPDEQALNKCIQVYQMYVRYARLIAKHFNWNPNCGPVPQNFNITWQDSLNEGVTYMKPEIHYDIFCCYYNLGVMYFYKAVNLCAEDFLNSRKNSIIFAKKGQFYFNQIRTIFYQGFANTGFSDTNYPHLELLECMCQGIIYKNMYEMFKEDEYKKGINKIASLAALAQGSFFKAYQIATQFFMKGSSLSNVIKADILSFSYVESLYHDVIANSKSAKYFGNQMDNDKSNIAQLIAYERKAVRLLNLGLSNENVLHLLKQRPEQKKELEKIKPQLEQSLARNENRNRQVYKAKEIPEEQLPPAFQAPQEYIAQPTEPKQIALEYDSKNAAPFARLSDNQSQQFCQQLKDFSENRLNGLESAYSKLQKNIETIYNDRYVNYYLNLLANTKNRGVPDNLKKKLQQIRMNGGKAKIQMEANIIRKNSEQARNSFQSLKNILIKEEQHDTSKRNQYGQQWRRPPSKIVQTSYRNQIENFEAKAAQADKVNQQIVKKCEDLAMYINICEASDEQILKFLPKVQASMFIEENQRQFNELKNGDEQIKKKMNELNAIRDELRIAFTKMDFAALSKQHYKSTENQEGLYDKLFGHAYKMIEEFNQKSKGVEEEARRVGDISERLNKNNRGEDSSKKQFEMAIGNFNNVCNLFRELSQGTAFYTKLNDIMSKMENDTQGFVMARQIEAEEIEKSLGRGGGQQSPGPVLPSMYPNQQPQQNLGFYVPPPMHFDGTQNPSPSTQNNTNLTNMLESLLQSKPSFDTNLFQGRNKVFQTKYK